MIFYVRLFRGTIYPLNEFKYREIVILYTYKKINIQFYRENSFVLFWRNPCVGFVASFSLFLLSFGKHRTSFFFCVFGVVILIFMWLSSYVFMVLVLYFSIFYVKIFSFIV